MDVHAYIAMCIHTHTYAHYVHVSKSQVHIGMWQCNFNKILYCTAATA